MKIFKKVISMVLVLALMVTVAPIKKADAKGTITGVKQVKATESSVKVSCDADLASGGYALEISTDKESWVLGNAGSNPNELAAENLTAGKSYYVRVIGYSSADYDWDKEVWNLGTVTAEASEPIEVVTVPDTPNMAVSQAGATTTGFSVAFSNVEDTGANFFRVCKDNEVWGEGSSNVVDITKTLSPGEDYQMCCYSCRISEEGFVAMDENDNYTFAFFKTLMNPVGTKNFGVSNAWPNINTFDFAVSDSDSARDGYQFQFATVNGKAKKTADTISTSISLSNFIEGTFYQYRVRSYVNCSSEKVFSKWSGYKTIAIPKKVTGKRSGKSLKVNWSNVSGSSGYTVYASKKENSGYKKVKSVSAKNRSVTIKKISGKKLKKGNTYYIRIVPKAKISGKTVSAAAYGNYSFTY